MGSAKWVKLVPLCPQQERAGTRCDESPDTGAKCSLAAPDAQLRNRHARTQKREDVDIETCLSGMIAVSSELNNTSEGAAMTNETLVQCLSRLESDLHLPEVRRDKHRLNALLHPDFEEVGRSGCYWSRAATLDTLPGEADAEAVEVVADRYHAVALGPNVALLTYRAAHRQADGTLARHTLRSSLWLSAGGRWQMRYHQGTPAAEAW